MLVRTWKTGEANLGHGRDTKQPLVYKTGEQKHMFIFHLHKLQKETQGTTLISHLLGTWVPSVGQVPILSKKEWVCGSEAGGWGRESQNSAPRL